MTDFLNWLNGEIIWGPPLIALIIITGVYVTVRSGFSRCAIWVTSLSAPWAVSCARTMCRMK